MEGEKGKKKKSGKKGWGGGGGGKGIDSWKSSGGYILVLVSLTKSNLGSCIGIFV